MLCLENTASLESSTTSGSYDILCLLFGMDQNLIYFLCTSPTCLPVHYMHSLCLRRPEGTVRAPGIGVPDGCETAGEYWESNLSPPEE